MADETLALSFDPDDLTLGEMIDFEDISGIPIGAFSPERLGIRAFLAIVYINGKRSNPNYTLDEAKAVKITSIDTSAMVPTSAAPVTKMERPAPARKRAS